MKSKNLKGMVTFQWQGPWSAHKNQYYAAKINTWRDYFPAGIELDLNNGNVGDSFLRKYKAYRLLEKHTPSRIYKIKHKQFNRKHIPGREIEPQFGRLYPAGIMLNVYGIYPENTLPCRLIAMDDNDYTFDMNHPLCQREVFFGVEILDINLEHMEDQGGRSEDWVDFMTSKGPSMEEYWQAEDGSPVDYFSGDALQRMDERDDKRFYQDAPCIELFDSRAREEVGKILQTLIPDNANILELMAGHQNYFLPQQKIQSLSGIGISEAEMQKNPALHRTLVHDLNSETPLPVDDNSLDAIVCIAGVEYWTKPDFLFQQIYQKLKPGGRFITIFNDQFVASKVVNIWNQVHPFERMTLVLNYLKKAGFNKLNTWTIRGIPRNPEEVVSVETLDITPLFTVWGDKPC